MELRVITCALPSSASRGQPRLRSDAGQTPLQLAQHPKRLEVLDNPNGYVHESRIISNAAYLSPSKVTMELINLMMLMDLGKNEEAEAEDA